MRIRNKNVGFFENRYLFELTRFYFKKLVTSYWFYLGIILIPFFFCLFLLTQLPAFLTVDSTIVFALIFNIIIFYGVLFFNFRKSHFYLLIKQKFNNHRFISHLPIFFNLIIITFLTFVFSLFFIFLFDKINWIAVQNWNNAEYHYQLSKISDYRWGLLIYYIIVIFIISISLAFLIQTLSRNLSFYILITVFIFVLIVTFSGTLLFTIFITPYSNHSNDLLYSYNPETQILTFKPYFDPSAPKTENQYFFNDFSIHKFIQMFNPFYYITVWGQYDIFIDSYRTTSLTLPGLNEIVIDQNDPSTWVKYDYVMFSFTNWLWASYIFVPYIFIFTYSFLGALIVKKKKKYND
ncbi:MAG: hypothetical protein HPPSJP_2780 [Candidatus Hepatoplasma scabrum]|nr:MAG: hypothetical protein HPPSJP_2780 [Candidatus Hepatoplasma sp.]